MHGPVVVLYFLVCLANKIDGHETYKVRPKVIGGESVDIADRPFALSLISSSGSLCGASILSKDWAITALHCLTSSQWAKYHVRAGSNRWDKGGSVHRVRDVYVYNDTTINLYSQIPYHDIALLKVKPPFRFSRTIRPIHLPRLTDKIPQELFVCGWGRTETKKDGKQSDILMGVYVRYVPLETCIKASSYYTKLIRDVHLCYGTEGKDACYGDSGAALADKKKIYGIVSYGYSCGEVPGVYANVSHYLKWIKSVTNL